MTLVTLLPLVFVFVHGSLNYRFRDVLVFGAITLVVSNIFENMSILTGFSVWSLLLHGWSGAELFLVPILIGPAYLGTGYLAWTFARVILGETKQRFRAISSYGAAPRRVFYGLLGFIV